MTVPYPQAPGRPRVTQNAGTVSRGGSAASVVLGSNSAVDGDGQSSADITHPVVAEGA